jgi:hypothetical protein
MLILPKSSRFWVHGCRIDRDPFLSSTVFVSDSDRNRFVADPDLDPTPGFIHVNIFEEKNVHAAVPL